MPGIFILTVFVCSNTFNAVFWLLPPLQVVWDPTAGGGCGESKQGHNPTKHSANYFLIPPSAQNNYISTVFECSNTFNTIKLLLPPLQVIWDPTAVAAATPAGRLGPHCW